MANHIPSGHAHSYGIIVDKPPYGYYHGPSMNYNHIEHKMSILPHIKRMMLVMIVATLTLAILPIGCFGHTHTNDIYMVNIDGSNLVNLTRTKGWKNIPMWSPNGDKIALQYANGVSIMNPDGSDKIDLPILQNIRLIEDIPDLGGSAGSGHLWSPDGGK